jgi:hypothetical protein
MCTPDRKGSGAHENERAQNKDYTCNAISSEEATGRRFDEDLEGSRRGGRERTESVKWKEKERQLRIAI